MTISMKNYSQQGLKKEHLLIQETEDHIAHTHLTLMELCNSPVSLSKTYDCLLFLVYALLVLPMPIKLSNYRVLFFLFSIIQWTLFKYSSNLFNFFFHFQIIFVIRSLIIFKLLVCGE